MTRYTLTISADRLTSLRSAVLKDESEYGALVVCGRSRHVDPWTGIQEERFLVREIIEVPQEMFSSRTPTGMTWSTTPLYELLKKAEPKGFAVGTAHSHPIGPLAFSKADDIADKESFEFVFNRLSSEAPHISIVVDGAGDFVGRAYTSDLKSHAFDLSRVIGPRWHFSWDGSSPLSHALELDRQTRTFGRQSTLDLQNMRIGIVGCGGTGSAVALLLARIGVGRIALFDPDYVDHSNLNRLHFSEMKDAVLHRKKVDVVGDSIAAIGLTTEVVKFDAHIADEKCREALRACDAVFGCTDDHLGRIILNHLAYFYIIPVIDLGLLIEPSESQEGYDTFDGRVTVIQPGYVCQVCRELISPTQSRVESLARNNQVQLDLERRAGYIPDLAEPSPAVVTFTTEVATMAVNELFHRLNGFRGSASECPERVRRFDEVKDSDIIPGGKPKDGCPLCNLRKYDARGDMSPFLNMTL